MSLTRKNALKLMAASATSLGLFKMAPKSSSGLSVGKSLKGNINHAVCRWTFSRFSLEEVCQKSKEIGIKGIDLLNPDEFATAKKYGLECSMSNGPGSIEKGLNRVENHAELTDGFKRMIPLVAEAGFRNIICFSGNKDGLDDDEGIKNCAVGIKEFISVAEKHDVVVSMEVLNTKVNHKDYHANNVPWTAKIADEVGSDYFKILFDIYHMQVDNGNIMQTIRDYKDYISHYHTAGVPGRNEIDDSQELNYPTIMKTILDTGFDGWVAQEFIPLRDPWKSLQEAVLICDV